MRTQKANNNHQTEAHWNNKYTLFSESVALLQKLISTPSFSGQESEAASIVEKHLTGLDIPVKRHLNNVWAFNKYFDPEYPTILLNSHLDTVKPNEGYTRDPFFPEVTDGKLYGLGSNDAGGCLISLMAAFINFYHQQHIGFNLCFAATAEEENSGDNGIKAVLPFLGKLHFAIVGEPTLLQMAIAEKGNMVLDCVCEGKPGHAAREEGDNAIYKCLNDLEWFKTFRFTQSPVNIDPVKMTVTEIKAGMQHNIVPGTCQFTVDIRNDATISHDVILEVIRKNVHSKFTVRPACLRASSVPYNHPVISTGVSLGCKTYNSPTSSDWAFLNCLSVKLGPGDSARSHSSDEYIFLKDIKKGIILYIRLLERLPFQLINNPFSSKNEINIINN